MSGVNAQAEQVEAMFGPVLQSKHSKVEMFSVGSHGISIPHKHEQIVSQFSSAKVLD